VTHPLKTAELSRSLPSSAELGAYLYILEAGYSVERLGLLGLRSG